LPDLEREEKLGDLSLSLNLFGDAADASAGVEY